MRNGIKFCLTCLGIAMALRLAFEAVTGQSVEMPNAPASTYHPPFWMGSGQEQNENPEPSAAEFTRLCSAGAGADVTAIARHQEIWIPCREAEKLLIKGDVPQAITS
jgi:hypothetical protein